MSYLLSKAIANLTVRERAVFAAATALFAISGLFAAWGTYYAATEEVPASGGSYAEGIVGQPTFVNPLTASGNEADYDLMELVFSDLGSLAESSAESKDDKVWTVTLKKGLAWDDGKDLTADDVVFTVETIQDINAYSLQSGAWQGIIAEKISDTEIRFTLKDPYAFFPGIWKALKVTPEHIFSGIPAANLRLSEYNLEPVGNGPYSWKGMSAEKDGFIREVSLAANPRYHGTKALMPSFTLRFYRTRQELIGDFNAKKIDGAGGILPEEEAKLAIGHRLASFYLPRYYALFFNQSTNPALKEKAVRQALVRVIDRKEIVHGAFLGFAAAALGPVPQTATGYDEEAYAENGTASPEAIRASLDAAGWLMNPEDGVRYKGEGASRTALRFDVVTPDIPFLKATMDIVAKEWKTIGVEAKIAVTDPEEITRTALRTRNYQIILYGNVLKGDPDLFAFWHSSRKFYPGLNLALYDNKEADTLLESVRKGGESRADQDAALAKIQRMVADDAPAAFLMSPAYLYAIPTGLKGMAEAPLVSPSDRLLGAESWYVKTKRVLKK